MTNISCLFVTKTINMTEMWLKLICIFVWRLRLRKSRIAANSYHCHISVPMHMPPPTHLPRPFHHYVLIVSLFYHTEYICMLPCLYNFVFVIFKGKFYIMFMFLFMLCDLHPIWSYIYWCNKADLWRPWNFLKGGVFYIVGIRGIIYDIVGLMN